MAVNQSIKQGHECNLVIAVNQSIDLRKKIFYSTFILFLAVCVADIKSINKCAPLVTAWSISRTVTWWTSLIQRPKRKKRPQLWVDSFLRKFCHLYDLKHVNAHALYVFRALIGDFFILCRRKSRMDPMRRAKCSCGRANSRTTSRSRIPTMSRHDWPITARSHRIWVLWCSHGTEERYVVNFPALVNHERVDWLIDWLIGRVFGWLIDWLIDCL